MHVGLHHYVERLRLGVCRDGSCTAAGQVVGVVASVGVGLLVVALLKRLLAGFFPPAWG